ncbi:S8 family serine peptidase [uncultured Cellulomonas sp.]|uniref:S8 family serine peptidase n=1 Tax=uncultured Cellulomonas sp. TaxID=189682 RepID=UPI00260D7839|nr:S8 family serine peptidase [uncultured Cellulomonas sp.]
MHLHTPPRGPVRAAVGGALAAALTLVGALAPAAATTATTLDVLTVVDGTTTVESVVVPSRDAVTTELALEARPEVLEVDARVVYQPTGTVAPDPRWDDDGPVGTARARQAWERTRGAGQVVAVLDTGVDGGHEDLVGAVLPGVDLVTGTVDAAHGTGAAGVVAARADNGLGSAGIAPEASILPVRVCGDLGCPSTAVARGILWAADRGADVINLSLSGPGYSDITARAVLYARERGIVVVASAGNDGQKGNPVMYPAAHAGVIAVGATDPSGAPAAWSVHGWQLDLSTVGEGVVLPAPGNRYGSGNGTSFSGPAVAGAAALVRASHPGIGPDAVQAALQAGVDSGGGWSREWGAGRLDIPAAIAAADRMATATVTATGPGTVDLVWARELGASHYVVRVDGTVQAQVTGTAARLTGLTDGAQVALDVQPGTGPRGLPVLAVPGPAAPAPVRLHAGRIDPVDGARAVLRLEVSVDGAGASRYVLLRDGQTLGTISAQLSTTPRWVEVQVPTPTPGEHRYQLLAADDLGRTAQASNAVAIGEGRTAPPGDLTGLHGALDRDRDRVLLTWDEHPGDVTYDVQVDGAVVRTAQTGGAVVPAPPAGQARTYRVRALDRWGQPGRARSVTVQGPVGPAVPPGAPTGVVAVPGDGRAAVSWAAPVAGGPSVTGYTLTVQPGDRAVTTTTTSATVTGLANGTAYTFTVAAMNTAGTGPSSLPSAPVVPGAASVPAPGSSPQGGPTVVTQTPARVLTDAAVAPDRVRCTPVAGRGGVPTGATGVILNVTTVAPQGPGYVVVYPDTSGTGATPPPEGSTVNFELGADVANSTFAALPANGRLCYATRGASRVGVLLDVTGYTLPGSGVVMQAPRRLTDTRGGALRVGPLAGPVAPRTVQTVQVTGRAGVPADATAVIVNVTVTGPTAGGNLRVYPADQPVPDTSVVNFAPGQTKANSTIVGLPASGRISFWSDTTAAADHSPVHVVIDVVGYTQAGTAYTALAPTRLLDSRPGPGQRGPVAGHLGPATVRSVPVAGTGGVPPDATAVVLNVTAVGPTARGNLRVYPDADGDGRTPPPDASAINYVPGRDIPNLVVVALPPDGRINVYSDQPGGSVHLVADVVGYIAGA